MVDERKERFLRQRRAGHGMALSVAAALFTLCAKSDSRRCTYLLDVFRSVLSDWLLVVLLVSIVIFGVVQV